jgi:phosphoribosylanthranilate isomerase
MNSFVEKIQVKICGITYLEDAQAAMELGADYLGFVLYDKSSRYVSPNQVRRIMNHLPRDVRAVGIFVNEQRKKVLEIARKCGLYAVQMHGTEAYSEYINPPFPVWRAVFLHEAGPVPHPDSWKADRYIIDAKPPGKYTSSGETADWDLASDFSTRWPAMLAGGLNEHNVIEAVRKVRPPGVDVAGGIEKKPGRKDLKKMELFIRRVKSFSYE